MGCETYIYVLDSNDIIVHISDNWTAFAEKNQAGNSCSADKVLNRPIWQFISGEETKHLYEIIMNKVRENNIEVNLPFRCDSPDKRRYLELHIAPANDGWLEFTSKVVREEGRKTVELLDSSIPRSSNTIKMCCMCKQIRLPEGLWLEAEDAIAELRLFDRQNLPAISHVHCSTCFEMAMAEINKQTV
jgi:hypothetical protein